MILPVTLTIAAAAAVINLWLALRVVPSRMKEPGQLGDEGALRLGVRMRAHANFTEYVPFVLILMALIELAGGSPTLLWIAGLVLILARIAHGFGMDRPSPNPLRAGGALTTWVILALLAGWAIAIAYQAGPYRPAGVIKVEPAARG